ncbi:hypothetical protein GQ600_19775 [Phytophthora cactorum]|nr:hypothetical protein GQ600_19775 [Phytophthora cactorum]
MFVCYATTGSFWLEDRTVSTRLPALMLSMKTAATAHTFVAMCRCRCMQASAPDARPSWYEVGHGGCIGARRSMRGTWWLLYTRLSLVQSLLEGIRTYTTMNPSLPEIRFVPTSVNHSTPRLPILTSAHSCFASSLHKKQPTLLQFRTHPMASPFRQAPLAFELHESRPDFLPEDWSDTDQQIFESLLLPSPSSSSLADSSDSSALSSPIPSRRRRAAVASACL